MTEKLKNMLIQLPLLEHIDLHLQSDWEANYLSACLSYLRMFRIKKDPTARWGPERFSQVRAHERKKCNSEVKWRSFYFMFELWVRWLRKKQWYIRKENYYTRQQHVFPRLGILSKIRLRFSFIILIKLFCPFHCLRSLLMNDRGVPSLLLPKYN